VATELEKALEKARYTALPLPRGKTGPTTIFAFQHGQLYVVRNAKSCLDLPVTSDPSVDTVQFTREYKFNLSGVVGFLAKVLGIGDAKAELEVHSIKTATVQMGGLSHETIETGALVDYLLGLKPSPCLRDLLDPSHLTIVAALKVMTFSFGFKSAKGTSIKLSLKEATGLFQADASVGVEVGESGQIVVNAPSYVGVVAWDGKTMKRELDTARRNAVRPALRRVTSAQPMTSGISSDGVQALRLRSLGVPHGSAEQKGRKRSRKK